MSNAKRGFMLTALCFCLLCCSWLQPPACSAAEKTYRVTESELSRLEKNLSRLQTIAKESGSESEQQKEQLTVLRNQLIETDRLLMKQQESLKNANELLQKYEDEQKKARRRMNHERTVWMTVIGVLLGCHLAK